MIESPSHVKEKYKNLLKKTELISKFYSESMGVDMTLLDAISRLSLAHDYDKNWNIMLTYQVALEDTEPEMAEAIGKLLEYLSENTLALSKFVRDKESIKRRAEGSIIPKGLG